MIISIKSFFLLIIFLFSFILFPQSKTLNNPTINDFNHLNNQAYVFPTNTNFTHLERYKLNTKEHFLRRSEITFFISIPFTLLWSNFLIQRFRDLSVIGAYFDGIRGNHLQSANFTYYSDSFPNKVVDPYYLFKWINATLWPLTITINDFIERGKKPSSLKILKNNMINNRFKLNLINQPSF